MKCNRCGEDRTLTRCELTFDSRPGWCERHQPEVHKTMCLCNECIARLTIRLESLGKEYGSEVQNL